VLLLQLVNGFVWLPECLERGGQINAIYTDFEKAFDEVPHQLILQKLIYYNVNPTVINSVLESRE